MLGSHNSFSYLPVKRWWMKLLVPWSKCQNVNIILQWNRGVNFFDLRVRLINGIWHIVHNRIDYGEYAEDIIERLYNRIQFFTRSPSDKVYIRIVLDERKESKLPMSSHTYKNLFKQFCDNFRHNFDTNIKLAQTIVYWDWSVTDYLHFNIIEDHSSVKTKWYQYILGTKWYANKVKHKYNEYKKSNNIYLVDYV